VAAVPPYQHIIIDFHKSAVSLPAAGQWIDTYVLPQVKMPPSIVYVFQKHIGPVQSVAGPEYPEQKYPTGDFRPLTLVRNSAGPILYYTPSGVVDKWHPVGRATHQ